MLPQLLNTALLHAVSLHTSAGLPASTLSFLSPENLIHLSTKCHVYAHANRNWARRVGIILDGKSLRG